MRASGITTSSLILKALVWRAMAAVRARSSQNLRRASALTAMKPSPLRALAMRTTSEVARRDRGLVVADDIAEQRHLRQRAALGFGGVADRAQVALVHVLEARELHAAARARPSR